MIVDTVFLNFEISTNFSTIQPHLKINPRGDNKNDANQKQKQKRDSPDGPACTAPRSSTRLRFPLKTMKMQSPRVGQVVGAPGQGRPGVRRGSRPGHHRRPGQTRCLAWTVAPLGLKTPVTIGGGARKFLGTRSRRGPVEETLFRLVYCVLFYVASMVLHCWAKTSPL